MARQHIRLTNDISDLCIESRKPEAIHEINTEITNKFSFNVILKGPDNSPYHNGRFILHFEISSEYPFKPPIVKFKTPIYHQNIQDGNICLDILKKEWTPAFTLHKILRSISSLLNNPNPDDPLAADVGAEYKSNYNIYREKALEMTLKMAI